MKTYLNGLSKWIVLLLTCILLVCLFPLIMDLQSKAGAITNKKSLPVATSSNGLKVKYAFTQIQDIPNFQTFVYENDLLRFRLVGPYEVKGWVTNWRSLVLASGTKIYRWDMHNSPKFIADFNDSPIGSYFTNWSISSNGKLVAVDSLDKIDILNLKDMKTVTFFPLSKIQKEIGAKYDLSFDPYFNSIVWKPDSQFIAVSLPAGKPYNDAGDDVSVTYIIPIKHNGTTLGVKRIGEGAPVAWINPDRLLVRRQVFTGNPDAIEAIIYSAKGKVLNRIGNILEVGWDGKHIILLKVEKKGETIIEVRNIDLRLISKSFFKSRYSVNSIHHMNTSLVGIP